MIQLLGLATLQAGYGIIISGTTIMLAGGFGTAGVQSINGISGVMSLLASGDNLKIGISGGNTLIVGQTGLSTLFDLTSASGALLTQIQSAAGVLSLNGQSGLLTLTGPATFNNYVGVSTAGTTISVTGAPFPTLSGVTFAGGAKLTGDNGTIFAVGDVALGTLYNEHIGFGRALSWSAGGAGFNGSCAIIGDTANRLYLQAAAVLVNTTTNSLNGAVQLATHTTSGGGLGLGPDNAIWRTAAGVLNTNGRIVLGTTGDYTPSNAASVAQIQTTSGAISLTIASTGQQAWTAANNNGINLSGNLTQTGVQLGASIAALSGFITNASTSNVVYTTGDQSIAGIKTILGSFSFTGGAKLSGAADGSVVLTAGANDGLVLIAPTNQNHLIFRNASAPATNVWVNYVNGTQLGWYNGQNRLILTAGGALAVGGVVSPLASLDVAGGGIFRSAPLLIGTTGATGFGTIQLAVGSTSGAGIGFGPDLMVYRTTSTNLTLATNAANNVTFTLQGTDRAAAITIDSAAGGINSLRFGVNADGGAITNQAFLMRRGNGAFDYGDIGANATNDMVFRTRSNGAGTTVPTLTLASGQNVYLTGNLGVGTTTPAYKLEVAGTSSISGNSFHRSGLYFGVTGDYTTMSGAVSVAQLYAVSGGVLIQRTVYPVSKVTGNFTVIVGTPRYVWSGAGVLLWTGSLPSAASVSGSEFLIKNQSDTSSLFLSGAVDGATSYQLIPKGAATLWSDGITFNII